DVRELAAGGRPGTRLQYAPQRRSSPTQRLSTAGESPPSSLPRGRRRHATARPSVADARNDAPRPRPGACRGGIVYRDLLRPKLDAASRRGDDEPRAFGHRELPGRRLGRAATVQRPLAGDAVED